jgi:hypothetical protein
LTLHHICSPNTEKLRHALYGGLGILQEPYACMVHRDGQRVLTNKRHSKILGDELEGIPGVGQHFLEYASLVAHNSSKDRVRVQLEDIVVLMAAANEAEQILTIRYLQENLMRDIDRHSPRFA